MSARELYVPSVVALEIAQKVWTGRLQLGARPAEWFGAALDRITARELPLRRAAPQPYELPELLHRDPADRILVAEARIMDAPLPTRTADRAYARAGHVQAVAHSRRRPTSSRPWSCRNAADDREALHARGASGSQSMTGSYAHAPLRRRATWPSLGNGKW